MPAKTIKLSGHSVPSFRARTSADPDSGTWGSDRDFQPRPFLPPRGLRTMQYYCEKGVLGDAVLGSWSPVLYAAKTTTTTAVGSHGYWMAVRFGCKCWALIGWLRRLPWVNIMLSRRGVVRLRG
jgi:hypothetical protein